MDDILGYNRRAWDEAVARKSQWTIPVDTAQVAAARQGEWSIILTPETPVPRSWFPPTLDGVEILCLAGGGGQQGPILAAAGANVTVFDNSPRQLEQDRLVAQRDGLALRTVQGDMADLHEFADATFDLIVHPCSNMFVPDVHPVWREAFRVLRPGGDLLAGYWNPAFYIFDSALADEGILHVRHKLPFSDVTDITEDERQRYIDDLAPLEFGHTLTDLIGGQLAAGFVLLDLFEDTWEGIPLSEYMPVFIDTRVRKPAVPMI